MLLTVKGQAVDEQIQVEFSLRRDGADVNVYANDDLIGWFEETNGKIRYVSSFPTDNKELFQLDENGVVVTAQ